MSDMEARRDKHADARLAIYIEVLIGQSLTALNVATARDVHAAIGAALAELDKKAAMSQVPQPPFYNEGFVPDRRKGEPE